MARGEPYRKTRSLLFGEPTMATTFLETWHAYHDLLIEGLAHDMGVDVNEEKLPVLVASMLWGGHLHTFRVWLMGDGTGNLTTECLEVIDKVIDDYGDQFGYQHAARKQ